MTAGFTNLKLCGRCSEMAKGMIQDSALTIRIPKVMKEKFIKVVKDKGLSYSLVLRLLIKDYLGKERLNGR